MYKSGNLLRVSPAQLDSGVFSPTDVVAGEFTIFAKTGRVVISKATNEIKHSDFEGKYVLDPSRKLSAAEQSLVPKLPEWYIIPPEAVEICKHAQVTTGKPMQMRNFLLRGPAGTGKTMGAKAIAAGLGLPYMKYTCSAGTEIFDFIGSVFPETVLSPLEMPNWIVNGRCLKPWAGSTMKMCPSSCSFRIWTIWIMIRQASIMR